MVVGQPGKLVPVYSGCGFKSHPRRYRSQSCGAGFFVQSRRPLEIRPQRMALQNTDRL